MLRKFVRRSIRKLGYDVHRFGPGIDPYYDLAQLIRPVPRPLVFDVGANIGQTIESILGVLNEPVIHAFEPMPSAFARLQDKFQFRRNIHLNNIGLGSRQGSLPLQENTLHMMTSFLSPGKEWIGKIERHTPVPVETIDGYCARNNISSIDFLKSDTQGFDLEVLKGADALLRDNRVRLVYLEIILSEMYENVPHFPEIDGFLRGRGFILYALYQCHVLNGRATDTDALYIHSSYLIQVVNKLRLCIARFSNLDWKLGPTITLISFDQGPSSSPVQFVGK